MNMIVGAAITGATIPAAALAIIEDQPLLDLERDILEAYRQATIDDDEISECVHAWRDEWLRLDCEVKEGRIKMTQDEVSEAIGRMPEVARQAELNRLAQPHFDRLDELVKEMWAIPARTAEGKRAKLEVLLTCIAGAGWLDNDKDADYDVRMTRSLILELLGGEQAERFKEQFAV
ncbi:hypothetical protein [Bradyrhizobium retamae]|uniref:Uncharacterized protein n=1 Tax=Bradyrhizobium retamae TaxID=1300035 RepID=A0A0R3MLB1_9BRAD|nr:hypothetical protein [Bradyrhizobium retamae]KRR20350.1 hypothetical protein CQ13_32410 [Bradyrhizobium retamae]